MRVLKIMLLGVILAVFFIFSLHISKKEEENARLARGISGNMFDDLGAHSDEIGVSGRVIYEKCKDSIVQVMSYSGSILNKEGTGVVVRPHVIMTNHHVISDSSKYLIRTQDGKVINASLIGSDAENDLALLSVSSFLTSIEKDLSYEAQIGDKVFSLSCLNGSDLFLSMGIIGTIANPIRNSKGELMFGYIGCDTVILNGASGSALINDQGKLIGLNYAVYSDKTSRGLSFSIPLALADSIADKIMRTSGRYERGGVDFLAANLSVDSRLNPFMLDEGVAVVGFIHGGESEKVLKSGDSEIRIGDLTLGVGGDVIVGLNGRKIRNIDDIYTSLATSEAGDEVEVSFFRNGKQRNDKIRLVKRGSGYEKRFIR